MLKLSPSLLFFFSLTAGATEEASTNPGRDTELFFHQCYINVPARVDDPNPLPIEQQPVNIEAARLYGSPMRLTYEEDVHLTQGDKNLSADTLTYYIEQEKVIAEGNVNFNNGLVTLSADTIERQLKTDETALYQTEYQFHGRSGRGDADSVYDNGQDQYELKRASYSACPPEDNTWSIDSTTLYIDNDSGVGSAYNAILRIKDVPVFYLPYVTYPVSDKRKTGLLFPTFELA
ncbi:LPS-assembly protein LptD, partial [Psychromonas sp.]|uniref:LPS-assembly protein LptD n=1 Tax=Psychromonas sp. TaxID=1884585 RepID=UPI00356203A8